MPPEGLYAKYEDLWQLCRDHPDIQLMLDEATRGRHGGDRGNQYTGGKFDNVKLAKTPTGNDVAYGFRKLSKYAPERPEVATALEKVKSGELSVNKALIDTGLKKPPPPSIPINASIDDIAKALRDKLLPEQLRRLKELL